MVNPPVQIFGQIRLYLLQLQTPNLIDPLQQRTRQRHRPRHHQVLLCILLAILTPGGSHVVRKDVVGPDKVGICSALFCVLAELAQEEVHDEGAVVLVFGRADVGKVFAVLVVVD